MFIAMPPAMPPAAAAPMAAMVAALLVAEVLARVLAATEPAALLVEMLTAMLAATAPMAALLVEKVLAATSCGIWVLAATAISWRSASRASGANGCHAGVRIRRLIANKVQHQVCHHLVLPRLVAIESEPAPEVCCPKTIFVAPIAHGDTPTENCPEPRVEGAFVK